MSVIDNLSDSKIEKKKFKLDFSSILLVLPLLIVFFGIIYILINNNYKNKQSTEISSVFEMKGTSSDLLYSNEPVENVEQFKHVVDSFTLLRSYKVNGIDVFDAVVRLDNSKNLYLYGVWRTRPLYVPTDNLYVYKLINKSMDVATFLKDVPYYFDYRYKPQGVWFIKKKNDSDERIWMNASSFDRAKIIIVGTEYIK